MSTGLSNFYDKKDYVFIFNPIQKEFYLSQGLRMVDAGNNETTGKIFWVFSKKESNPIYTLWLQRENEKKAKSNLS